MIKASICTIGDEILIGQIVDTNSSGIASALEATGIKVRRMVSLSDDRDDIIKTLEGELKESDLVVVTGGLGPTKDDITKPALAELSGSEGYVENKEQMEIVREILRSRGLDLLDINKAQAFVPDRCEVIPNRFGTAPIMVFRFPASRFGHRATLYAMPGVPHETMGMLPDVLKDIRSHFPLSEIHHRSIMVYGTAESALSKEIEPWENALPDGVHLAYLPNPLTGIRLRLSSYGGSEEVLNEEINKLKAQLGSRIYSDEDDNLSRTVGRLLLQHGKTMSCAESCTGGEIAHLITSEAGSSGYFLGSVTSYAVSVKESVLGVSAETINKYGVVSSEVAAAMSEGVRKLTGSDYSVATTGLSGPGGDGINPVGTVWIGISGPNGTRTVTKQYHNDRKRNIQRFAATALDCLRLMILEDYPV